MEGRVDELLLDTAGRVTRMVLCTRCDADVQDLPVHGACAGCGQSVRETIAERARGLGLLDDGTVCVEWKCRRCGYRLRGLDFGGRCPECAEPVQQSLLWVAPSAFDAAWLSDIRSGGELAAIGLASLLGAALLALVVPAVGAVILVCWATGALPISVWFVCATARGESPAECWIRRWTRLSVVNAFSLVPLLAWLLDASFGPLGLIMPCLLFWLGWLGPVCVCRAAGRRMRPTVDSAGRFWFWTQAALCVLAGGFWLASIVAAAFSPTGDGVILIGLLGAMFSALFVLTIQFSMWSLARTAARLMSRPQATVDRDE